MRHPWRLDTSIPCRDGGRVGTLSCDPQPAPGIPQRPHQPGHALGDDGVSDRVHVRGPDPLHHLRHRQGLAVADRVGRRDAEAAQGLVQVAALHVGHEAVGLVVAVGEGVERRRRVGHGRGESMGCAERVGGA